MISFGDRRTPTYAVPDTRYKRTAYYIFMHFFYFQLAEYLGILDEIVKRIPTTDTYSAEVTQTEFFFGIDFELLDPILYGLENSIPADEVGAELGLTTEQVERVYKDILQKQRTTRYLRLPPLEIDQVE